MNKFENIQYNINPQPVPSVFNEGYSQYETLSKLLYLVNQHIENMNTGAEEIEELKTQKLSIETYMNDLANNRKLSAEGDFTGTLNGLPMSFTNEGLATDWNNAKGTFDTVTARLNNSDVEQTTQTNLLTTHATQLKDIEVSVKMFGAKGDGTTDDTLSIQNAINSIESFGGLISFPVGTYLISDTIKVSDKVTLIGKDRFRTIITDNESMLDKPLIANKNYGTQYTNSDICIKNIKVLSIGERTVYTVCLQNTISPVIENLYIEEKSGTSSTSIAKHGLEIDKANGNTDSIFVARVINSRFSRATLKINVTDSYVRGNELWGNERDCAVNLSGCSNSMITNNQLVGGKTYGAIYISSDTLGLKISNNYFDGSYYNIDTKWGIYCTAKLQRSIISNNNFWYQKSGAIYCKTMEQCTINANVFDENDRYENKVPDVHLDSTGLSWGNVFTANTHRKQNKVSVLDGTESGRTTTTPSPAYKIKQVSGYPITIISNNSLSFSQFYGNNEYVEGTVKALDNSSSTHFIDRLDRNLFSFHHNTVITSMPVTACEFGGSSNKNVFLGAKGSVVSLSINLGTVRSAGVVTAKIYRDNVDTGFAVTMDSENGNNYVVNKTWDIGTLNFTASNIIGVRITTDSAFLPTNNTAQITLGVVFD